MAWEANVIVLVKDALSPQGFSFLSPFKPKPTHSFLSTLGEGRILSLIFQDWLILRGTNLQGVFG